VEVEPSGPERRRNPHAARQAAQADDVGSTIRVYASGGFRALLVWRSALVAFVPKKKLTTIRQIFTNTSGIGLPVTARKQRQPIHNTVMNPDRITLCLNRSQKLVIFSLAIISPPGAANR
jgi:hypothetical protein